MQLFTRVSIVVVEWDQCSANQGSSTAQVPTINKQLLCPQKHYSEKEAAELMRCLIEFLAFMHSKGLMHRDLKPENIMLSSRQHDATMKIIDFGTADFCPADLRLHQKFGTPLYVALRSFSVCLNVLQLTLSVCSTSCLLGVWCGLDLLQDFAN